MSDKLHKIECGALITNGILSSAYSIRKSRPAFYLVQLVRNFLKALQVWGSEMTVGIAIRCNWCFTQGLG